MKNKLDKFTDDELQKEINERNEKKRIEYEKKRTVRIAKFRECLTMTLIDALVPEHGRTSCSDENVSNGFGSNGDGAHRCARCALLDIFQGRAVDDDIKGLHLSIGF